MTAQGRTPFWLAAALGLTHAFTFAPWGNWWSALLVLVGLGLVLETMIRAGRRPVAIGLAAGLFGFGWFAAGVYWLFISMHTYGAMPAPLAALAVALFAAYLALFPVLAAVSATMLRSASGSVALPLGLAALLTLGEILRGFLFTGFPWLAVGYAQTDGPLTGYAAVGGVYLVGFSACLVAFCCSSALLNRRPLRLGPPAALLALGALLGQASWSEPVGPPLSVRLIQGNVPQQMKFDPAVVEQTMVRYAELIEAGTAKLIVLPETAWTMPWRSTPPDVATRIARAVDATGAAVAIGMPLFTPAPAESANQSPRLSNSVLLFDTAVFDGHHPPPRYDKRHLVPFGEFVPWGFRWFVDLMTIPLGDFERGAADQTPFAVGGQRVAFNICFEDVFGEELLPSLAGSNGATILANVSNVAWFGDSAALPQHLQIARMRSLETARPMIRATNTGITAAIDFDGTVLGQLPPFRRDTLAITVQGRQGLTPYARTGNLPVTLLALFGFIAAIIAARRLRRGQTGKPQGSDAQNR